MVYFYTFDVTLPTPCYILIHELPVKSVYESAICQSFLFLSSPATMIALCDMVPGAIRRWVEIMQVVLTRCTHQTTFHVILYSSIRFILNLLRATITLTTLQ